MQDRRTRDELLLWLNDRLGKSVAVSVELERGDSGRSVFEAEGELSPWRQGPAAWRQAEAPRYDLVGFYKVGDSVLDLSDIHPPASVTEDMAEVALDEYVVLRVVVQEVSD